LADGSIQACNKTAEKLLGLTTEQLLGRNSIDPPWQTIHEDGSTFRGETHPAMLALKTGKPCLNVVMGLYKPNGELIWLLVNSQPLFQTGGIAPYGVITTLTDITASKHQQAFGSSNNSEDTGQSEAAFIDISDVYNELHLRKQVEANLQESQEQIRMATTAANLGMWFWDLTGDKLVWTQECKALFGLAPDAEITYDTFLNSLHPEDRQRTHEAVTCALENKTEYDIEYRTIWSDGSVHWIAAKGRAFYDSQGKPVKMMGTTQDITQTKQLEIELRQQAEELTQTNNIKDQFLAILSHELRSPLNPILGWAKLLKSRKFDDKATYRALDTIERNAKLQIQLIDDLLDVSRVLRGKLTLNFAAVELTSVIDAAVETVRLSAEAKSIQLTTQLDSNIGQILGDSYRLQQVVGNLLTNAIKFTPQGGQVEVKLSVERLGGQGDGETRGWGDKEARGQGELSLETQNSKFKTQNSPLSTNSGYRYRFWNFPRFSTARI
jgi:PAS domain S-box-containing protein